MVWPSVSSFTFPYLVCNSLRTGAGLSIFETKVELCQRQAHKTYLLWQLLLHTRTQAGIINLIQECWCGWAGFCWTQLPFLSPAGLHMVGVGCSRIYLASFLGFLCTLYLNFSPFPWKSRLWYNALEVPLIPAGKMLGVPDCQDLEWPTW